MNQVIIKEEEVKIVSFDTYEAQVSKFESKFKDMVYDFDDEDQAEQAKQNRKEIRKAYNGLEVYRKDTIREAGIVVNNANIKAKVVKDRLTILTDSIDNQKEAYDQIEIKKAAALHNRVEEINNFAVFDDIENPTIEDAKARLESVKATVIDSSFESREADAHISKAKASEILEGKIALLEKQQAAAEQTEKDRLKAQEEREEQIRVEAAATAVKAEQEKSARVAKEKEQAEIKEQNRLKEVKRKAATKLKAKKGNLEHRKSIHSAIKMDLINSNLVSTEDQAVKIVQFIIKSNKIEINY